MFSQIIFWLSLCTLVYVYFGFIILLSFIAPFRRHAVQKKDIEPSISIIICAHNEEGTILEKINNCLSLDYPQDKIEIIIVSDGSFDRTNDILNSIDNPKIKVLCMPERIGKSECQNKAATEAHNDVLFFTDATTMHPPDALKLLVRNLYDPTVGCVTGRPVFKRDESMTSLGLNKREKYELYLRRKLNEINTLFGAQDCMYAIPGEIFMPTRKDLDSGFVGPLKLLEKGYRTIYEFDALAFIERRPPTVADEVARRSRIVLRGLRGILHMRHLMNPFAYGFTAIALLSSRLLRWMSPLFLIALFISNIALLHNLFYQATFLLQLLFYLTALIAFFMDRRGYRINSLLYIPLYFCILMYSAIVGFFKLIAGETGQTWETRR